MNNTVSQLTAAIIILVAGCQQQQTETPEESITLQELRSHVYYLASDMLQGRGTGTEGYLVAANYAASQFRLSGLLPAIKSEDGNMTYFQQVFPGQNTAPETYTTDLKPDSEVVKLLPNYRVSLQKVMVPSDNVAAMVIGTDPMLRNEYITASAHLDHLGIRGDSIYNGADDNSSGCSLILEVAEAVALSRPKRSVLFILYTAEEFGLLGSEYFIKNSPMPVNDIKANLNFDMIGRPDGIAKELGTIGAEEPDPRLQQLIFSVNDMSAMLELDTTDYDNYFRRSDQYSFYTEGIPSVLFTTGEQPDYHTPDDDPEKINYEFLKKVSILAYEVIIELANE